MPRGKHAAEGGGLFRRRKNKADELNTMREVFSDFTYIVDDKNEEKNEAKEVSFDSFENNNISQLKENSEKLVEEVPIAEKLVEEEVPIPEKLVEEKVPTPEKLSEEERRQEFRKKDFDERYQEYINNFNNNNDDYYDDDDEGIDIVKTLIVMAIVLLIAGGMIYYFKFYKPSKEASKTPTNTVDTQISNTLISDISGYSVLGKIKIDSLNVDQYILNSSEIDALNNGVGKIDNGANLNSNGNFCMAGHNKEGVFKNIETLEIGSVITIVDRNLNEFSYKVTEVKEVEPDNLDVLIQDQTNKKITLVTCKDGATQRYIVTAIMQDNEIATDASAEASNNTN